MNTTTRCTRRRPRSITKLTADLDGIAMDLFLIVSGIEEQQKRQIPPTMTVPRFRGEDIRRLASAMSSVVLCGELLESIAKDRAVYRSMFPEERRELIADRDRHADQPTSGKVMNVPALHPSEAPQDSHDTSAAAH